MPVALSTYYNNDFHDEAEEEDLLFDALTFSFNDLSSPVLEDNDAVFNNNNNNNDDNNEVHPTVSSFGPTPTAATTTTAAAEQDVTMHHYNAMDDDDDDDNPSYSLGQIASVAQSRQQEQQQQSAARVRRRRDRSGSDSSTSSSATTSQAGVRGSIVGGGAPLRRQRRFYQLDVQPWLVRTTPIIRRSSADNDGGSSSSSSNSNNGNAGGGATQNDTVGSYDENTTTNDVDLLQAPRDRYLHNGLTQRRHFQHLPHPHLHLHNSSTSISSSSSSRDPRLLRRTRSRLSPWIRHHHQQHYHHYRSYNNNNNNCVGETAVDLSRYNKKSERRSVSDHQVLDFDIVMDDGGQYRYEYDDGDEDGGSLFGVENILQNDDSVYCSGRSGTINILMQYCGSAMNSPVMADKSCVISQIVIKSPQQGFTAPCKEGLFFVSYNPIDIDSTAKFDHFTKNDYERYVRLKGGSDCLDDSDPVAWFSMSSDRQDTVHLNDRVGKYVLVKLLRAEGDSENIDLQYVAIIGYSGARAFAGARIC